MKPWQPIADPDRDKQALDDLYEQLRAETEREARRDPAPSRPSGHPADGGTLPPQPPSAAPDRQQHYALLLDLCRDTLDRSDVWSGLRHRLYAVVTELKFSHEWKDRQ